MLHMAFYEFMWNELFKIEFSLLQKMPYVLTGLPFDFKYLLSVYRNSSTSLVWLLTHNMV